MSTAAYEVEILVKKISKNIKISKVYGDMWNSNLNGDYKIDGG